VGGRSCGFAIPPRRYGAWACCWAGVAGAGLLGRTCCGRGALHRWRCGLLIACRRTGRACNGRAGTACRTGRGFAGLQANGRACGLARMARGSGRAYFGRFSTGLRACGAGRRFCGRVAGLLRGLRCGAFDRLQVNGRGLAGGLLSPLAVGGLLLAVGRGSFGRAFVPLVARWVLSGLVTGGRSCGLTNIAGAVRGLGSLAFGRACWLLGWLVGAACSRWPLAGVVGAGLLRALSMRAGGPCGLAIPPRRYGTWACCGRACFRLVFAGLPVPLAARYGGGRGLFALHGCRWRHIRRAGAGALHRWAVQVFSGVHCTAGGALVLAGRWARLLSLQVNGRVCFARACGGPGF
jgi:hypothetical protein